MAKLSRLRDRGPRGGGWGGGSLCFLVLSAFFSGKHGFHVSPAIAARKYIKLVKTRLAPPRIVDKKKHEGTEALKQKTV